MDDATLRLLALLNDRNVRYVVIGAAAFPIHGHVRNTRDTDVFFEPTLENTEHLRNALIEFGLPAWDATIEEFRTKSILFDGIAPAIDTLPHPDGADWATVWARRKIGVVRNVPIPFASLDDLILMKRAAGRPKDLDDLKWLEAIKARRDAR